MKKRSNESGAALVMTLMIITLLLLFIMTLLFQITNTTKQVTTMEKNIVAEQIAQMGVDYFRTYIDSIIPDTINDVEQIENLAIQELNLIELDVNHKFWIESEAPTSITDNEVVIEFTSFGEANGKKESIQSSIKIQLESGDN
jgi:type II secretory pathway component PulK